jgi:thioesterase domain-containing protein
VAKKGYEVMAPKVKNLTMNPKAVQTFYQELEESEARFKEYQHEQRDNQNMGPSRVEGWSFVGERPQF